MTCDKIKVIRDRLKIAQNRQKSYADNRRRDLEFEVGDMVFEDFPMEGRTKIWETWKAESTVYWTILDC